MILTNPGPVPLGRSAVVTLLALPEPLPCEELEMTSTWVLSIGVGVGVGIVVVVVWVVGEVLEDVSIVLVEEVGRVADEVVPNIDGRLTVR